MTHASMDAAAQKTAGIGATLIRLSVGIENADDLLADLQQAFNAVAQHNQQNHKQQLNPQTDKLKQQNEQQQQQFRHRMPL